MKLSPLLHHSALTATLALTGLLLASCASSEPPTPAGFIAKRLAYAHAPAPAHFAFTGRISAVFNVAPAREQELQLQFGRSAFPVYRVAVAAVEVQDLADSGLFSRVQETPEPDFALEIESQQSGKPDYQLTVTYALRDLREQRLVNRQTFTVSSPQQVPFKDDLAQALNQVKRAVAADLTRKQQQVEASAAVQDLEKLSLSELITASDSTAAMVSARNHVLIAAKNHLLADLLRNASSADLTTLVVKIEQVVLDLSHNSEVAKDRAQQAFATNATAAGEEQRDLALGCRERIELLKPILAALKDELANRSR